MMEATLAARPHFLAKIQKSQDCWIWTGFTDPDGYGVASVTFDGKVVRSAHQAMFLLAFGSIPAGMVVHHNCGTRACVNPAHLEAVSQRDNVLYGASFAATNAQKTTCVKGHAFTESNTYQYRGQRACRKCRNDATERYKARRRAEL